MSKSSAMATYVLSAALFSIAAAIAYFTYELSRLHQDIPAILTQVENTSGKVDPILAEVTEIRKMVPTILTEIAAVRGEIPSIVNEISETRKQIPPVLQEVKETRESIPAILKTVESASASIDQTNKEIAATRPLVPDVLKEVKAIRSEIEATRKSIPGTLKQVDELLAKASIAGQKATEGAVTGVFTGVITAPFRALSGIGRVVAGDEVFLEGEDLKIATEAAYALTEMKVDSKKDWQNPASNSHGTLTLLKKYKDSGIDCVSMKNQVWKDEKKIIDRVFDACRKDTASPWEIKQ